MENDTTIPIEPLKPKRKKRRWWKFWLVTIIILAGLFYFLFLRPFSVGFREGYVTKLSKKGVVFKTWEGELIRNQFSAGTNADIFKFSVADEAIANQLNKLDQRKYLKLRYNEYFFQIFFKGDTKYFIDEVQILPDVTTPILTPMPQVR